jgi:hypothetical protein
MSNDQAADKKDENQAAAPKKAAAAKKEVKKEEKPAYVKVSRDNLTYLNAGIYILQIEDIESCKVKGAFMSRDAKDFGIRVGDLVICKSASKAELVVVQ